MVANGEADASYVDSLVLEFEQSIRVPDAFRVRVIDTVGPAGIVPAVVSLKMPVSDRQKLRNLLLHMHEDKEGKAILSAMLLKRFDPVRDSNYDDIRQMKSAAEKGHFTEIGGRAPE
jgi:phosphonate transport system substrate-binding protein